MAVVDRAILHNLANIENIILGMKQKDPKLYLAIHNLANVINTLIDYSVPDRNILPFIEQFYIPAPATGVIPIAYKFKMPLSAAWIFNSVTLLQVIAIVNANVSGSDIKVDCLVSQNQGTTAFKSILKSPVDIPVGLSTSKEVKFSIDTFSDGDLLEFDVTQIDSGATGIGLQLFVQGVYNVTAK